MRARRSCASLSRRAGYRSNVVHRWEKQQGWPTAAAFLGVCSSLKLDVTEIYSGFFRQSPTWLGRMSPRSREAVAAFLCQLRGKAPISALAARAGVNRYTMSRWLKGTSERSAPDGTVSFVDARYYSPALPVVEFQTSFGIDGIDFGEAECARLVLEYQPYTMLPLNRLLMVALGQLRCLARWVDPLEARRGCWRDLRRVSVLRRGHSLEAIFQNGMSARRGYLPAGAAALGRVARRQSLQDRLDLGDDL